MKDFDDLFRMSQTDLEIDWKAVKKLTARDVPSLSLDTKWINPETSASWERHIVRYQGLPEDLETLFGTVNRWISNAR